MPRGRYIRNPAVQAEDLLDEEEYLKARIEAANAAVEYAQLAAPVGTVTHTTKSGHVNKPGDYKRGLKTVVQGDKVYASGTDWKSHWIEWGSVNNTPSAPLRRGAQAVGMRLRKSPKSR